MAPATKGPTAEELARCLDDLESGRLDRDEFAASASDELREIVGIVAAIRPPAVAGLDPATRARQRRELVATIADSRLTRRFDSAAKPAKPTGFPLLRALRPGLGLAASFVVAVSALGGGTVYAARDSLPGDSLYAIKAATERVQLALAKSEAERVRIYLDLADRRLAEVERARQSNRAAAASLAAASLANDLAGAKQSFARAESTAHDPALAALLADHLARTEQELASIETGPAGGDGLALAAARQEADSGITLGGEPEVRESPTDVADLSPVVPTIAATATLPDATETPAPTPVPDSKARSPRPSVVPTAADRGDGRPGDAPASHPAPTTARGNSSGKSGSAATPAPRPTSAPRPIPAPASHQSSANGSSAPASPGANDGESSGTSGASHTNGAAGASTGSNGGQGSGSHGASASVSRATNRHS